MLVNEGLPLYVVSQLEKRFDLSQMTVGILGHGLQGRLGRHPLVSLSYKLRRVLKFKAKAVLCTDPHVTEETDPTLIPARGRASRSPTS